jgi:hypothetical protein
MPLLRLTFAALALLAGCEGQSPAISSLIRGRVVDTAGVGVPDAALLLRYELDCSPADAIPPRPAAVKGRAPGEEVEFRIEYSLEEAGHVQLSIFEDCRGASAVTLVDRLQPAGSHVAVWDGRRASRRVPNDLYTVRLQMGAASSEHGLFLNARPDGLGPAQVWADALTLADGSFALSQGCLPFDAEVLVQEAGDPQGQLCRVMRRVEIWVLREGREAFVAGDLLVDAVAGLETWIVVPE